MIKPDEFKAKLKAAGWTQKRVSTELGYDASWLSKIIHGARDMKCEDLLSICKLTGIPPEEFLGWDHVEPAPKGTDDEVFLKFASLLTIEQREKFKAVLETFTK